MIKIHPTKSHADGTTIVNTSENTVVAPGEDVTLSCSVEGKPLTEEHVRWEREDYDLAERTEATFANGTSYLHIRNAQREDVGNFRCIADNRVANPTSRDVLLIVKCKCATEESLGSDSGSSTRVTVRDLIKRFFSFFSYSSAVSPEIDKSTMLRAATGAGEKGRLPCRVLSAPQPIIAWTRNGQALNVNQSSKYSAEYRQIDPLTFESILVIERVAPADYGKYECAATNELGSRREFINLEITSPPEAPSNMTVLNVTHDSVTVSWSPGFDGGMKAHFRVRYREANSEHYRYEDGIPNLNKLTVTGLRTNTVYLFSIMAINGLGNSTYIPDLTKAQTTGKREETEFVTLFSSLLNCNCRST